MQNGTQSMCMRSTGRPAAREIRPEHAAAHLLARRIGEEGASLGAALRAQDGELQHIARGAEQLPQVLLAGLLHQQQRGRREGRAGGRCGQESMSETRDTGAASGRVGQRNRCAAHLADTHSLQPPPSAPRPDSC